MTASLRRLAATTLAHDGRLLWRQPLPWLLLVAWLGVLALALLAGSAEVAREQALQQHLATQDAARQAQAGEQARQLLREGGTVSPWRDPRNADVVGRRLASQHALLPPTGLALLGGGAEVRQQAAVEISLEPLRQLLAQAEPVSPRHRATGRLDASFVVVVLAPLLIIALGFGVLTWERQHGLLPLLRVQRAQLGGWLALRHGLRLGVVLLPALMLVVALVLGRGLAAGEGQRLLLWCAVAAVYLLFWCLLCAAVTAWARGTAQALLSLLGAWLLLVVMLPGLVSATLELRYPAPDDIRWVDAMREATDGARAEGSRLLVDYLEDHPELAGEAVDIGNFFARRYVVQRRVEAALEPLAQARERRDAGRERLAARLRFLSPALLAAEGLADAAGTGQARQRHFQAQVTAWHHEWRAFFEPHILSRQAFTAHADIPGFHYREEPPDVLRLRLLVVIAGLLGLGLLPALSLSGRLSGRSPG